MINRRENWLADLPAAAQALVGQTSVVRVLQAGEEVVRAGSPSAGVFQVLDGYVKLTELTRSGDLGLIAVYGPGNCWGESPIVADRPHNHTTVAMTDIRLRFLPRSEFLALYAAFPQVSDLLCRKFANSMSRLMQAYQAQRSEKMARLVARAFYSFINDMPGAVSENRYELDLPLTQAELASYLRVSRQSIQPEITCLRSAGVIEKLGDRWIVHDVERLRRLAVEGEAY